MARTFDIRFAQSSGFAALLEAPTNTFRWKGGGLLSIDDSGVEIEPKTGIHSLLARRARLRINAADMREVSRVGNELRIEFGMPGSRRAVVPFWVRDRNTAAEIMSLVPTRRTIELEQATPLEPGRERNRAWAAIAMSLVVVLGAAIVWNGGRPDAPSLAAETPVIEQPIAHPIAPEVTPIPAPDVAPIVVAPTVAVAALSKPGTSARDVQPGLDLTPVSAVEVITETASLPAAAVPPAGDLVAFVPGDRLYDRARQQFDAFQEHAANFYVQYLEGKTPPADLAASWARFSERVAGSADSTDPKLRPLIDDELAAAAGWRDALMAYAEATRARDESRIAAARTDLQHASELTARVALHIVQP